LNLGTYNLNVAGNFTNVDGCPISGTTGAVVFNGTVAGKTITTGGSTIPNIQFTGSGGEWTLQDNLKVKGQFKVTSGKFISGANTVTMLGASATYQAADINAANVTWSAGSTLNIQSNLDQILPSSGIYNNLQFGRYDDVAGTTTYDILNSGSTINGTWTIDSNAKVRLTVSATGINKVYDGFTTATVTLSDNRIVGKNATFTTSYTAASFSDKNVGSGKIVSVSGLALSGADASKYVLSSTTASTTANITAKSLTGSFTVDATKVYDAGTTANVLARTLAGVISPDVVTLSGGTADYATKNVGNNITVTLTGASLAGADKDNYTLSSVNTTTANITAKQLTVDGSFTANNKIYDGSVTATINTSTLALNGVVAPDVVTLIPVIEFGDKNAGTGKTVTLMASSSLGGADKDNYTLSVAGVPTTTANITPKSLTGSFTVDATKPYDAGTGANVTGRFLSGVIGLDDCTLSDGTADYASKNVGNGITVSLAGATLAGADKDNYNLTSVTDTSANITPKDIAVTGIAADNKVYDATTNAVINISGAVLSGVVPGDTVNLSTAGATGTFADKNAGIGKTVDISGLSLSGADSGNYNLTSTSATATADITPGTLTVTATGENKVYDGTTTATVTLSDDRIAGDVLTDSYVSATFADTNVGTGKTITVTGISISGADAGNYLLSSTTAIAFADIAARPVPPGDPTRANYPYADIPYWEDYLRIQYYFQMLFRSRIYLAPSLGEQFGFDMDFIFEEGEIKFKRL